MASTFWFPLSVLCREFLVTPSLTPLVIVTSAATEKLAVQNAAAKREDAQHQRQPKRRPNILQQKTLQRNKKFAHEIAAEKAVIKQIAAGKLAAIQETAAKVAAEKAVTGDIAAGKSAATEEAAANTGDENATIENIAAEMQRRQRRLHTN